MIKDRQGLESENPYEENHDWRKLLATSEGLILEIGLIIALLFITVLGVGYIYYQEKAHVFIGMSATNILFGRAAGISFGYSFDISNVLVICTNIIVETILVLIFYPFFVFSWQSILIIKPLRRIMERTNTVAEAHQDTIRRYGLIGLFMFVWFPFWMTGPMVGCAAGYLLGLSPWKNLTIVLSSTCLAVICWALLLRSIHDRIAEYGPYASMVLVIMIIIIVSGIYFLRYLRHKY
ncbi:MAG: small multi-drug export protein [Candidatus Scalindua rubra]|uniref:Putative small multi-drug export protein n=1 Tax=Candidatus Scalindua brodae TaxID=237368 RepID=A0A0B0EIX0_9BACT|nr:MAG: putative small multi-drug export protein [Candidatus Scalindua brodae]MBZ0108815.1 small multi-drug export protein [Candidatus Scalindua rubra]TWU34706.1 putative small multi-drug export protein [Candidatus Brocadiaceae bacterium S225]